MTNAKPSIRADAKTGQLSVRVAIPVIDNWFDYYGLAENGRLISGSEDSSFTTQDITWLESNNGTLAIDYTPIVVGIIPTTTVISGSSVELNGYTIESVGEGTSVVNLSTNCRTLNINITANYTLDSPVTAFKEWVSGSLALTATNGVDLRISGLTGSDSNKKIFTTQNHSTSTYVRNSSCWINDIVDKITCCSPWNSLGSNTRAGALVTDRHIIYSNHYNISDNTRVRFVDSSNNVYEYTLLKSKQAGTGDFRIGVLNQSVDSSIYRAKLFRITDNLLPNLTKGIPVISLDQEEKALVTEWFWSDVYAVFRLSTNITRASFYEAIIGGDSGNPTFLILNNELALLTVWHNSNRVDTSNGPYSSYDYDNLVAALTAADIAAGVETNLALSAFDVSGFNTY